MTHLKNSQQENLTSSGPYYSQHDLAVVNRLKDMTAGQGLGDAVYYDDDYVGALKDFGIELPNVSKE
jgi:hypothetical protein